MTYDLRVGPLSLSLSLPLSPRCTSRTPPWPGAWRWARRPAGPAPQADAAPAARLRLLGGGGAAGERREGGGRGSGGGGEAAPRGHRRGRGPAPAPATGRPRRARAPGQGAAQHERSEFTRSQGLTLSSTCLLSAFKPQAGFFRSFRRECDNACVNMLLQFIMLSSWLPLPYYKVLLCSVIGRGTGLDRCESARYCVSVAGDNNEDICC
jgi:hypothetical protein